MALFNSDWEAILYISLIFLSLYGLNRLIGYVLKKSEKISNEQKNKAGFILRIGSIVTLVYFIIEGFPSFNQLPEEYTAILTGSISTGLAFVSSEIFANIVSGLLLFVVDPFDIGHVVKIKNKKGIVRSITLTKVVIETFNNIMIEFSNNDIVNSTIVNYTIELDDIENFYQFRKKLETPQDKGNARVDVDEGFEKEKRYERLKKIYKEMKEHKYEAIHAYTFRMAFPYEYFRVKIDRTAKICVKYEEKFGLRPRFHMLNFGYDIEIKFSILTFHSVTLMDYQPEFAQELYQIILQEESF